jgi:hypothetical protein
MKDSEEFFRKLGFEIIKLDPGEHVNCDLCNEEYMDSTETGGFMFDSNAVCPKCAPTFEKDAARFNESDHIRERARKGETFRDFVYRMRER